jgi:hypothetical protein
VLELESRDLTSTLKPVSVPSQPPPESGDTHEAGHGLLGTSAHTVPGGMHRGIIFHGHSQVTEVGQVGVPPSTALEPVHRRQSS